MSDIRRLTELRDRVAAWASHRHEAEFLSAVRCYLGDVEPDEDRAAAAVSFALISAAPDGASFIDRFAAQAGHLPRAERVLFQRWARARFSVVRVLDTAPGHWVDVHDVLREEVLRVHERTASHQLEPGTWLAPFLLEVDGRWEFEGAIAVIPRLAHIHAVQAALLELGRAGLDPRSADPAATRRIARPVMEAIHQGSRRPRLVNADGHDIRVITLTLDVPWERVREVVGSWEHVRLQETVVEVMSPEVFPDLGGPPVLATFRTEDGEVTVYANSQERMDAVLARWLAAAGSALPVLDEEVREVDSNPDGPILTVDATAFDAPEDQSDADLEEEFLHAYVRAWLDRPIPSLGGQTPRQAFAAGRRSELWALLPEDESGDEAAWLLGLELPDGPA